MIASSRLSRMFSARSRESSIYSGVTAWPPAPLSLPAGALTQLRKVCSTSPSSFATPARACPSWTRFDRRFLEFQRVCLLRYLHSLAFQSDVIVCHPWKTKFRGNLNLHKLMNVRAFLFSGMTRGNMPCGCGGPVLIS